MCFHHVFHTDFALLKNRRARRQNEEGSNSPARTNHSKPREGGMFVSYLSQKPAAADVMEEEEDMEVEYKRQDQEIRLPEIRVSH